MKIYKKDSTNKLRELDIYNVGDVLYQVSGLVTGKKVSHAKFCKPKNVGKSNATTAAEQAALEAEALIAIKLTEGYSTNPDDVERLILPMLAEDYFKKGDYLSPHNMALQPKLDGIRCLVTVDYVNRTTKAITRNNKPIENISCIFTELLSIPLNDHTVTYDGELYVHGKTFQEVSKLFKNSNSINSLNYHIYDVINPMTFKYRNEFINDYLKRGDLYRVREVETFLNISKPLDYYYNKFIENGYEGMMVRNLDSFYKIDGRSNDLLKYKKFIDVALPIEDITPNDANAKHGTVWVKFNGKLQKTGAKLSHEDREDLLTNKKDYIGKMAEIRYFEETDEGLMRFPVYHGIRIDK